MRLWTTLALLAALVGSVAAAIPASAYNCTTQCYGSGSFRTCNTSCF
jgi:hypothetical protein